MDGIESLRHAIETIPIPGAPPRLSRQGAAVGLALLDTSLRLNHVRRLTERLTVVEHGTARRSTEVDVSLKLLDEGQRQATAQLQDLIGQEHGERAASRPARQRSLWVPLARLPRRDVSPVDVFDSSGQKLPRLTQHEASRLVAAGLYRLLRGILASDENAQTAKHELNTFLFQVHEPRWLIQQALLTLLTERDHPEQEFALAPTGGTVPGYGRQCRELALDILTGCADLLVEYTYLLNVAVRDYMLVVALDDAVEEHRLSYETPLHVDARRPLAHEQWRRLASSRHGYVVSYETMIPATLKSYHLVARTAPEAEVSRMYLSTDADQHQVDGLAEDLRSLAERQDAAPLQEADGARHKILELQAQSVLRRLADLVRRRKWEAGRSGVELSPRSLPACHRLAAAATTGEAVRIDTNELDNSLRRHPEFTSANLREAARELTDREFGQDLVLVNGIADNEARAYWRRSGGRDPRGDHVRVRATLVLRDSTKSGPLNVTFYALAVATVSFVLGWLLVGSPWPYGRAATQALGHIGDGQSVITMLLLLPGFLYSRLSLPPRRTVLGYLGTLPQALVQLSIAAVAGFAAAVATESRGEVVQAALTVAVALPVLAALVLAGQASWRESAVPLSRIGAPRWAGTGAWDRRKPLEADVRFDSSGGVVKVRGQRISVRNVADLARACFEIARQPVTKVDFEVHHAMARHGYLRELVSAGADDPVFLETLCSATNGAGVVIGTRTRKPLDGTEVAERADGRQPAERPEETAGSWVFHQTTSPNPTFIYESAQTFEGLIAVAPGAREVCEWHGLAVRDLVREISDAASSLIDAPLLSLQCPAQLPTIVKTRNHDLRTRKEVAPPCASLAVRFSIALRDASAAARFELADRFRELCEKHGYSFWLADTRPGHRQGNWFEVYHADGEFSPLYKGDLRSRQRVGTVFPLTFVGPARIGSTHAIAAFLQRYPQVGVVGCAATTLSDVAFVHLQLAIHGVAADRLNRILGKLLGESSTPARPHKLLRELFKRLGLPPDPDGRSPAAQDPTSDYQTFAGPAFAYRPYQMPDCMAVWVSWEIARQHRGLAAPLDCLYRALGQVAPPVPAEGRASAGDLATVEYLICRATEQSVIRGKAKLAVPKTVLRQFSSAGGELPASKLCASLEEAWKAQVDQSGVDGVSELTVAWRESWLGHWTYS